MRLMSCPRLRWAPIARTAAKRERRRCVSRAPAWTASPLLTPFLPQLDGRLGDRKLDAELLSEFEKTPDER